MKKGHYISLLVLLCVLFSAVIISVAFTKKAGDNSLKPTVVEPPAPVLVESNRDTVEKVHYEFKLIREFNWNNGIDSLHISGCYDDFDADLIDSATFEGECPPPMGPDGLMVNSSGDIYIFDLDQAGEGWGAKLYDPYGKLLKYAPGGRPIGFDAEGNVYLFDRVYDGQLNLIKTYMLPQNLETAIKGNVTDKGMLIFVSGSSIYECDPYSPNLVKDTKLLKSDPKLAELWKTIQCNIIGDNNAPLEILYKKRSSDKTHSINALIGESIVNQESCNHYPDLSFLSVDERGDSYWLYNPYSNYNSLPGRWRFNYYYIGIFNADNKMISKIPHSINLASLIEFPNGIDKYLYIVQDTGNVYEITGDAKKAQLIEWKRKKED